MYIHVTVNEALTIKVSGDNMHTLKYSF